MNDTFMINICSLDIQKMGKSLENNVSFSSNCMLDLNLLKEHLMSVFSKEDIVNIGKERVVLTLDSTKIAILTDIVLIHYLEKEMKFRKMPDFAFVSFSNANKVKYPPKECPMIVLLRVSVLYVLSIYGTNSFSINARNLSPPPLISKPLRDKALGNV